jgi:hypothetical protein
LSSSGVHCPRLTLSFSQHGIRPILAGLLSHAPAVSEWYAYATGPRSERASSAPAIAALTLRAGRINRRAAAPARAIRGSSWLLLFAAAGGMRPEHGKGGRGAHGRRRHERHKEFNARATRDRPRGAGTGCPPAQRRVNPRSKQSSCPPSPGTRRVCVSSVRRLPRR